MTSQWISTFNRKCCCTFTSERIVPLVIDPESDPRQAARNANISITLFALGGVIGLFEMTTTTIPFGKGFEMVALANNLAHHGAYANPFGVLDTGPTAVNPPLYPFLLAIFVKVFRNPDLIALAATFINILANALIAVWLPQISYLFYRDIRPGVAASILWLLSVPLMPSWDTSYTVATLLLFCLLTYATIPMKDFAVNGTIAGLLAGALFLFNPSTILIFVPWIAFLSIERRAARPQFVRYCTVLFAVFLLCACGWAFRNYQKLGKFAVRTNLGMTLYASDNDCAGPSLVAEEWSNCYQTHHPIPASRKPNSSTPWAKSTTIASAHRMQKRGSNLIRESSAS
jgi:hypothetical protein